MSKRIRYCYPETATIYAIIRRPDDDYVWNVTDSVFEAWVDANIGSYDVPLTARSGNYYSADWPSGVPAGDYDIYLNLQSGAAPAVADITMAGPWTMRWTGVVVAAVAAEENATYICNLALLKLGGALTNKTIADIGGTSETELICAILYPHCRDWVLRHIQWREVSKYAELTVLTVGLPEMAEWEYACTYPADCIGNLKVVSEDDHNEEFDSERLGGYLFCNDLTNEDGDKVYVKYTTRETDAALYEVSLDETIATKLAAELAPSQLADWGWKRRATLLEELHRLVLPLNEGHNEQQVVTVDTDRGFTWDAARFS